MIGWKKGGLILEEKRMHDKTRAPKLFQDKKKPLPEWRWKDRIALTTQLEKLVKDLEDPDVPDFWKEACEKTMERIITKHKKR